MLDLELKNIFPWLHWQIIFTPRIQPELKLSQLGCHEREVRLRSFILLQDDSKYSKKEILHKNRLLFAYCTHGEALCTSKLLQQGTKWHPWWCSLAFLHPLFEFPVAYYPMVHASMPFFLFCLVYQYIQICIHAIYLYTDLNTPLLWACFLISVVKFFFFFFFWSVHSQKCQCGTTGQIL